MQTPPAPSDPRKPGGPSGPSGPSGSSSRYIAEPWSVELSVKDAREEAGSRHHDQQMPSARTVPADPYTAWLAQREPDRHSSAVPV
jgi:hypothetical protein